MFESFCLLICHDSEAKWKYSLSIVDIMVLASISTCNSCNDVVSATVLLGGVVLGLMYRV